MATMSTRAPGPTPASSSAPSSSTSMTTEELTRIATLYYVDGQTQEELSRRFGISRATVGRMLRK
ncbi:MAG: hypothetical protein RL654_692, partial [Pseudomonadota bacterium]